ncbi:YetF domain-containing protein [Falsiroseomonas sp. CW058]|uniref:DUF421 domain-containing protein n=1 Tax=Falsiroseomonas sp. CW058 TaxID=3388664 RepID=UPI003D3195D8
MPLANGAAGFAVLVGLQWLVAFLSVRSARFGALVKSEPTLLLHRGRFLEGAMRGQRVTREEVVSALRASGVARQEDAAAVVLETDGSLSVIAGADQALSVLPRGGWRAGGNPPCDPAVARTSGWAGMAGMDLGAAIDRLDALATGTLALLPGLAFGLGVFGLFLLLARGVGAGVARAVRFRSESPGLARVLGRIGGGLVTGLGVLVGAAVAFPSINAADLFSVLGIGMGDDIAEARRVLLDVARGAEGVLADPPPKVRVAEIGDFAVQLDVMVWIDPPQRAESLDVVDRVLERGKVVLLGAGIDLPYPTQQMLFHDQTEASDGDRARQREGWPVRPRVGNPPPRWQVANDDAGLPPAGARPAAEDGRR